MTIERAGFVVMTCAAAAFADGYDVQALGLAIPRMAADLHLVPTDFAAAASTSLIGIALGAMGSADGGRSSAWAPSFLSSVRSQHGA